MKKKRENTKRFPSRYLRTDAQVIINQWNLSELRWYAMIQKQLPTHKWQKTLFITHKLTHTNHQFFEGD